MYKIKLKNYIIYYIYVLFIILSENILDLFLINKKIITKVLAKYGKIKHSLANSTNNIFKYTESFL